MAFRSTGPVALVSILVRVTAILGLSALALNGCSSDEPSAAKTPTSLPADAGPVLADCPASPEALLNVDDREESSPSWEALDCFASRLSRPPLPAFLAALNADLSQYPIDLTAPNLGWQYYNAVDAENATTPGNRSMWNSLSEVPPFADSKTGAKYTYPLQPEQHERKLRYAAAIIVDQKLKGRLFSGVFSYPKTFDWTVTGTTKDAFLSWFETRFIPEKVIEAKALERVKADAFIPFPLPLEAWVENLPFTKTLSLPEKVALAQAMIGALVPKVREHFKGVLMASSGADYGRWGTSWSDVDFSSFDAIGFSIVPTCKGAPVDAYLTAQFEGYLRVLGRAGAKRWGIGEVVMPLREWVSPSCMTEEEFDRVEFDTYGAVMGRLKSLRKAPNPPSLAQFGSVFANESTRENVFNFMRAVTE
jgi:hypothetical protein